MAWTGSGFFTISIEDHFINAVAFNWEGGTWKVSLFPNSITPDYTAARTAIGYNTGTVWTSGNELTGGNWTAGGYTLAGMTVTPESPAAGQVKLDATDVSQTGTTITNARGCLIYMDSLTTPQADQGLLAVDFGSDFSTSSGTFAITWDTNGVAYFDVW